MASTSSPSTPSPKHVAAFSANSAAYRQHGAAAAACGARGDVIDERGERPRAVGRRASEPSDGVERLGAEVPAERDPVRPVRHGGDDLQPAVGDDGGGAAAGGAVGEGVGAADERVHRDGAV